MPGRSRSDSRSRSASGEKVKKNEKTGNVEKADSHSKPSSNDSQDKNGKPNEFTRPAVTNRAGTKEQPLSIPGYDTETGNFEELIRKEQKAKESGRKSHSRSSKDSSSSQTLDIAKILRQQAEILAIVRPKPPVPATGARPGEVIANQPPVNQPVPPRQVVDAAQAGAVNQPDPIQIGDNQQPENQLVDEPQDEGIVAALNLAFKVDPNAGTNIDSQIAQFIENCINLPSAIEWDDMKVIREIYKRPGNCPSIGVPGIPDTLSATMSGVGKSRDQSLGFMQSWVMTAMSAVGAIADDLKPFEMDETVPWARAVYVKALDVIRILAHLSVNEISKRRKEEVKTFLPKPYKKIATPKPQKPQIKLFGEELNEDVRVCEEEAKMTSKLKSIDMYQGRFIPYRKPRGRSRFSNPGQVHQQHGNWGTHYNNQAQMPPPPPMPYQGFHQPPPNVNTPPYRFPSRPYNPQGRGQKRRGNRP